MLYQEFIAFPLHAAELHFSPPQGESVERLRRMEVLDSEGLVRRQGVRALCIPNASTLYDNLLECGEDIAEICETLAMLYCNEEVTGMYLYLCLLYGQLGEVVPEPLQWLSSNREALLIFGEMLVEHMTTLLLKDGFVSEDEDGDICKVIPISSALPDAEHKPI